MARIMAELPGVGRVYSGLSARKDLAMALHRSRQLALGHDTFHEGISSGEAGLML